jgi:hypothetical protein
MRQFQKQASRVSLLLDSLGWFENQCSEERADLSDQKPVWVGPRERLGLQWTESDDALMEQRNSFSVVCGLHEGVSNRMSRATGLERVITQSRTLWSPDAQVLKVHSPVCV